MKPVTDSEATTSGTDLQPQIVEGVSSHVFEDQLLIFSEGLQKLYSLNPSAALIWSCYESHMSFDDVAAALMQTYGIAREQARADVTDALSEWAAVGLVGKGSSQKHGIEVAQALSEEWGDSSDLLQAAPGDPYSGFRLRLAGVEFVIRIASEEIKRRLSDVLGHLESKSEGPARRVEIVESGGLYRIYAPRVPVAEDIDLRHLIPVVTQIVLQSAYKSSDFLIAVHAAVLGLRNQCMILPGQSGNGKTTLAAAMIANGFKYFTDEVGLVDRSSQHVIPAPVGLRVKESGWNLIAAMFPDLDRLPWHVLLDGQRLRYLRPPPGSFAKDPEDRCPARWIVFPRYAADAQTGISPISRVDAISRLQSAGYDIGGIFDRAKITEILSWLKTVDCYEMTVKRLDKAVTLLRSLAD
jgi:hypothetical protein